MGKKKPKKRKNNLARPPKKRANPQVFLPPFPVENEAVFRELDDEFGDDSFGEVQPVRRGRKKGTVSRVPHPSLELSRAYQNFCASVKAIRATLPEAVEKFAIYDLPKLEDRRWVTRYCIKKEKGVIPGWQERILDEVGFNWVRGRDPEKYGVYARKKGRSRGAESGIDSRWMESYEKLAEACSGRETPVLGLLHCDEKSYAWLRRQVQNLNANRLSASRRKKLEDLPFDFEWFLNDAGFGYWRSRYLDYLSGKLKDPRRWEIRQAVVRRDGEMPEWRIEALDAINFNWSIKIPEKAHGRVGRPKGSGTSEEQVLARWRAKLDRYCELREELGRLPKLHDDESLRPWLSRMRTEYLRGRLRPELIEEFEARGFEFDTRSRGQEEWDANYAKLIEFKKKFGHVRVPSSYGDDPKFGVWFARQQESMRKGKMVDKKVERLKALGVRPRNLEGRTKSERVNITYWLKGYRALLEVLEAEYGGRMPETGRFSHSIREWLKRQAKRSLAGELEPWQVEELDAIGFNPKKLPERPIPAEWPDRLARLKRFIQEHGHGHVPSTYSKDKKLLSFVGNIRLRKRKGNLNRRELAILREAGFVFAPTQVLTPAWQRHYEALLKFYEKHGHSEVPRAFPENQGLAEFVAQQRQRGRYGLLLTKHIELLDDVGFRWLGERPVGKDQGFEAIEDAG